MQDQLNAVIGSLQAELTIVREDRDNLKKQLDEVNQGTEAQLRKEITDLQEINQQLEQQLLLGQTAVQADDLERITNECTLQKEEIEYLKKEIEKLKEQIVQKNGEITKQQSKNQTLQNQLNLFQERIDEVIDLREQVQILSTDNMDKDTQIQTLNSRLLEFKHQVDEQAQENRNLQAKISALSDSHLQDTMNIERNMKNQFLTQKNQLDDLISSQANGLDALADELANTKRILEETEKENSKKQKVIAAQNAQVTTLQDEMADLMEQLNESKMSVISNVAVVETYAKQIIELKRQLNEVQRSEATLINQCDEQKQQIKQLKLRIYELQEKVNDGLKAQEQIIRMQDKLQHAETQICQLQSQLSGKQQQSSNYQEPQHIYEQQQSVYTQQTIESQNEETNSQQSNQEQQSINAESLIQEPITNEESLNNTVTTNNKQDNPINTEERNNIAPDNNAAYVRQVALELLTQLQNSNFNITDRLVALKVRIDNLGQQYKDITVQQQTKDKQLSQIIKEMIEIINSINQQQFTQDAIQHMYDAKQKITEYVANVSDLQKQCDNANRDLIVLAEALSQHQSQVASSSFSTSAGQQNRKSPALNQSSQIDKVEEEASGSPKHSTKSCIQVGQSESQDATDKQVTESINNQQQEAQHNPNDQRTIQALSAALRDASVCLQQLSEATPAVQKAISIIKKMREYWPCEQQQQCENQQINPQELESYKKQYEECQSELNEVLKQRELLQMQYQEQTQALAELQQKYDAQLKQVEQSAQLSSQINQQGSPLLLAKSNLSREIESMKEQLQQKDTQIAHMTLINERFESQINKMLQLQQNAQQQMQCYKKANLLSSASQGELNMSQSAQQMNLLQQLVQAKDNENKLLYQQIRNQADEINELKDTLDRHLAEMHTTVEKLGQSSQLSIEQLNQTARNSADSLKLSQ